MLISVVSVCSVLLFGYGVAVVKRKRGYCFSHAEDTDAQMEGLSHQQAQATTPLLCAVEGNLVRMPEHRGSIELTLTPDVRSRSDATIAERDATIARQRERAMPFLEASPSPVLVVCRNMRIAVWSPGMSIAAPVHFPPLGQFVSDLPFVDDRAGSLVQQHLETIIEAPPLEHLSVQTIMLHLNTKAGPVLLEMCASVLDTESEHVVVMTGREVETGLAGFISRGSFVSSEGNDDHMSGDGTNDHGDHDDDNGASESKMSSLVDLSSIDGRTMRSQSSGVTVGIEEYRRDNHDFSINWTLHPDAITLAMRQQRAGYDTAAFRDNTGSSESSWVTPEAALATSHVRRIDDRIGILNQQHWASASSKLQQLWRRRRADIVHPHSMAAASEAMRASPETHEHIVRLIAHFKTGVPSARARMIIARHQSRV